MSNLPFGTEEQSEAFASVSAASPSSSVPNEPAKPIKQTNINKKKYREIEKGKKRFETQEEEIKKLT